MGADGGVCYMPLHNPSKYPRVLELLKPFYFLTAEMNANWQQETCDEFWENSPIGAPSYLCGNYGSFQDFDICNSLVEVLDPDWSEQVCSDPSLTFADLIEDLETRPFINSDGCFFYVSDNQGRMGPIANLKNRYDAAGQRATMLEVMVWDLVHYGKAGRRAEGLGPIAEMKVSDWVDELRSLLDYKHTGYDETWT